MQGQFSSFQLFVEEKMTRLEGENTKLKDSLFRIEHKEKRETRKEYAGSPNPDFYGVRGSPPMVSSRPSEESRVYDYKKHERGKTERAFEKKCYETETAFRELKYNKDRPDYKRNESHLLIKRGQRDF
jgi:hypothetical protein